MRSADSRRTCGARRRRLDRTGGQRGVADRRLRVPGDERAVVVTVYTPGEASALSPDLYSDAEVLDASGAQARLVPSLRLAQAVLNDGSAVTLQDVRLGVEFAEVRDALAGALEIAVARVTGSEPPAVGAGDDVDTTVSEGGGSEAAACELLSPDDIAAAVGEPVQSGETRGDTGCAWNLADDTGNITIDFAPPVAVTAVGSEPIEGLGDQAVCTCGRTLTIIGVVSGDLGAIVQVSNTSDAQAGAIAVAEALLAAL